MPARRPRITVFGPSPLLTVTVEALAGAGDDIHLHPGGQGVWVTRTAGELGAAPILCGFIGGETGVVLQPLLEALPGELRLVHTSTANGCAVVDRDRASGVSWRLASATPSRGTRSTISSRSRAPRRWGRMCWRCAAATRQEVLPDSVYGELVATARTNGVPSFVDLSSPSLDVALEAGPDVVKINDWQLAEWLSAPVDGPRWRPAAERLLAAGARCRRGHARRRACSRGQGMATRGTSCRRRLERGFREGCGDSMLGAMAAATAAGETWEHSLVVGAAAGAACFLRQGLGSAKREVIDELAERVELRHRLGRAAR